MRIAPPFLALSLALSLAITLVACGQKGPLVLPDAQPRHQKVGVIKPQERAPRPASAPLPAPAATPSP